MNQIPYLSRRRFLELSGLATLASLTPSYLRARPDDFITISILHTTDLHGHILPTVNYEGITDLGGFARCASQIRFWRRKFPHHLLVDLGDTIQGTAFGYESLGQGMIECLNHLDYNAWVIGNHEFDWGPGALEPALGAFGGDCLTANAGWAGGTIPEGAWSRLAPFQIYEIAGFKIGVLGLTTPGLPAWFRPELLEPFDVQQAAGPARAAVDAMKQAGVDTIVLGAHMGLTRSGADDFANQLGAVTAACPEIVACLGGHTHRDVPNARVNHTIFSQASYHGIHLGRLDLTFDRATRQLLHVQPVTALMDQAIELDPVVLSLTEDGREASDSKLATVVGILLEPLSIASRPGQPSDLEELFARAIKTDLSERGHPVDAVLHGMFFPSEDISAGPKTIGDLWQLIPYENMAVTVELSPAQIATAMNQIFADGSRISLMGLKLTLQGSGRNSRVVEIRDEEGRALDPARRYTLAMNSYDAAGGGRRLMHLRDLVDDAANNPILHKGHQTREALIRYFQAHQTVTI